MKHTTTIFSLTIFALLLMAAVLLSTQPAYACGGYLDPDVNADYYYSLGANPSTNGGNIAGAPNAVFNGTTALTTSLVTTGDQAASFPGGSADNVTIAADTNAGELNAQFSNRTYELWFSPASITGRQQLFEHGGTTNGGSIYLDGNTVYAGVYEATTRTVFVSYTGIEIGKTYHVVAVFDGSANSLTLYVNSALVDSGTNAGVGGTVNAGADPNALGDVSAATQHHDGVVNVGGDLPFTGVIDELAIYPNVAVQADVTAAFTGCHPTAVSLSNISSETTTPLALIGLAVTLLVITAVVWKRERLQQTS